MLVSLASIDVVHDNLSTPLRSLASFCAVIIHIGWIRLDVI